MDFTTNSGKSMTFDYEKWVISESRFCNVIGEEDAHYLLENKYNMLEIIFLLLESLKGIDRKYGLISIEISL